jgi:hypothetical protein
MYLDLTLKSFHVLYLLLKFGQWEARAHDPTGGVCFPASTLVYRSVPKACFMSRHSSFHIALSNDSALDHIKASTLCSSEYRCANTYLATPVANLPRAFSLLVGSLCPSCALAPCCVCWDPQAKKALGSIDHGLKHPKSCAKINLLSLFLIGSLS